MSKTESNNPLKHVLRQAAPKMGGLRRVLLWIFWLLWIVGISVPIVANAQVFPGKSTLPTPWLLQRGDEDSVRTKEKDPTMIYFRSNSQGWNAIKESEKALEREDFKMVLYNLMQAQARFEAEDDQNGLIIMHFKTGALYQRWEVYERAVEQYLEAYKLGNEHGITSSFKQAILLRMAACSQQLNKTEEAIGWYQELQDIYKQESNWQGVKYTLTHIADLLIQKSDYQEALKKYYEMADVEERLQNPQGVEGVLNNIGFLYKKLGDPENALRYFRQGLQINIKNKAKPKQIVSSLINLGSVCNQLGDFKSALSYLEQALKENETTGSTEVKADLKNFVAITHYNKGSYYMALRAINSCISLSSKHKNKEVLVRAYRTKASILEQLMDHKQASLFYVKYADLKDSINYEQRLSQQTSLMKNLSVERVEKELRLLLTDAEKNQLIMNQTTLEAEREIRQKELQLLQREKEIQDYSLRNQALKLEQNQMETQRLARESKLRLLELNQKDQVIKLEEAHKQTIEQENTVKVSLLKKDKILLEVAKKGQTLKIKSQKDREQMLFGLVALSLIAIAGAFVSLSRTKTSNLMLRVKQDEVVQQNDMLESMNRIIETKNQSITDSMNYARKIQAALLPGPETLYQMLPLSFLFFRPRDVVSGDFYFLHRTERFTLVASVDCTGHGVAGALLSMLGHQALKQIIEIEKQLMPDIILKRLDAEMDAVFLRESSEIAQGMDIGIALIDRMTNMIFYSGAVHSLFVSTPTGLQVHKGSRSSIGGLMNREEKEFPLHQIQITGQMQCYLASDGMPSQLGGPNGKRFTTARLKRVLEDVDSMPAASKRAEIERSCDTWMKGFKQTDDMLIIGFRADLAS